MDQPGTVFADVERGIYTTADHCLWFADPKTNEIKSMPIRFSSNIRVITHKDYDPFILVFEDSGYLSVFNTETTVCTFSTVFPVQIGIIETAKIKRDGLKIISVSLKSNKATYVYSPDPTDPSSGHWRIESEPIETLTAKSDNKVPAQKAELENELNSAIHNQDFDAFKEAMTRYLFFLAIYASTDSFLAAWYECIKIQTPFDQKKVNAMYIDIIDLLTSVEKVSHLLDELRMVLIS